MWHLLIIKGCGRPTIICKGVFFMKELVKVVLPEGCFMGNCSSCVYANWHDKDKYGRVYCEGRYGGYNYAHDRNGCFYYESED